eukprot:3269045-Amphidinium_carterae.1
MPQCPVQSLDWHGHCVHDCMSRCPVQSLDWHGHTARVQCWLACFARLGGCLPSRCSACLSLSRHLYDHTAIIDDRRVQIDKPLNKK